MGPPGFNRLKYNQAIERNLLFYLVNIGMLLYALLHELELEGAKC